MRLKWAVPTSGEKITKVIVPYIKQKVTPLYALTESNSLIAFDRNNGRAIWWVELGSEPMGDPVASAYSVFIVVDNMLIGIDAEKGGILWKVPLDFPSSGKFVAIEVDAGNPVFVMGAMNRLVYGKKLVGSVWPPKVGKGKISRDDIMIERKVLHQLWKYPTEGGVVGQLNYKDSFIYFGDTKNKVYCVDSGTISVGRPHLAWKAVTTGPNVAGITVGGAYSIVCSRDQNVYCFMRRTGGLAWRYETGFPLVEPAEFVADPKVRRVAIAVRAEGGELLCLSTQGGSLLWQRETGDGKIVGMDDEPNNIKEEQTSIVVGYNDGSLEAVQFQTGKSMWKFPAGLIGNAAINSKDYCVYAVNKDGNILFALNRPK
jgi:outer membrane protein assembly factor BamB